MSDYNLTLFEACEFLNRSKKSISRYIRRGLLHPKEVKSKQGTLEYRFSKDDLKAFKTQEKQNAEQTRPDRTEETRQTGHIEVGFIKNKEAFNETKQDTPDQTGQRTQDKTGQNSEVITLLKETTGILKEQLIKKDEQIRDLGGKIDELIQRDRETNILLKGLQDRVFMLEGVKESQNKSENEVYRAKRYKETQEAENKPTEANTGEKQGGQKGFFSRLFNKKG